MDAVCLYSIFVQESCPITPIQMVSIDRRDRINLQMCVAPFVAHTTLPCENPVHPPSRTHDANVVPARSEPLSRAHIN